MNPILERFSKTDTANSTSGSGFQVIHEGAYLYFQTAPRIEQVQTNILFKELPLGRIIFICMACVLSYEFYTSPFYNSLIWFAQFLSWVLIANFTWYAWQMLQNYRKQLKEAERIPQNLFFIDTHRGKLVLNMQATDSKSPYHKIEIDELEGFYAWHQKGEDSSEYIYAFTRNGGEIEIANLRLFHAFEVEEMALILGELCKRRVWRRQAFGFESHFELIYSPPRIT